jgi:hypothetical protein
VAKLGHNVAFGIGETSCQSNYASTPDQDQLVAARRDSAVRAQAIAIEITIVGSLRDAISLTGVRRKGPTISRAVER